MLLLPPDQRRSGARAGARRRVLATTADPQVEAADRLLHDEAVARRLSARDPARTRYGLDRFLAHWDRIVEEERCASR